MNDEKFLLWLTGFIDGEGCFSIIKKNDPGKNRYGYQCSFWINLRADDYKILVEIRDHLGLGRIYQNKEQEKIGKNLQLSYKIIRQEECLRLVEILDKYPLRAKKAVDFAIWRLAVIACNNKSIHGGKKQSSPDLWADVAELHDALRAIRIYQKYDDMESLIINSPVEGGWIGKGRQEKRVIDISDLLEEC